MNQISVTILYPGATAEEVEEGICLPMENSLEGINGVKRILTVASDGIATAILKCETYADVDEIKDDVKTQIDAITTFPNNSEKPTISKLKFDSQVMSIAVSGHLPERQLKKLAQSIKDELITIPGISKVTLTGARNYEINIEISESQLQKYSLTLDQVAQIIRQYSLNLS